MARRETWRGMARRAARDYPGLKRAREDLRQARITPSFEANISHQGSPSRSTEAAALRELPPAQARRLEAVERALTLTKGLTSGPDRLRLVRMVYFDRRKTLEGAALEIPCSVQTAQTWNHEFLLVVYSYLIHAQSARPVPQAAEIRSPALPAICR